MAMAFDSGSWKPRYDYSAFLSGQQNAMAEQQAEEDITKSILANLEQYTMMPGKFERQGLENLGMGYDNKTKALAAAQADMQNNPEALKMFLQSKQAEQQKAIREDELSKLLQPFKIQAAPFEGQATVDKARGNAAVVGNQAGILTGTDQSGNQIPAPVLSNMRKGYKEQVATQGYTPEHWSKATIEDIKGEWDLKKANIMASAQRDAASTGGKAAWAQAMGPATQLITQTQNALAKLNSNEMDEQLAGMIATRGLKPGTPEFEAALKTEKDNLRVELNKQLTEGTKFLQDIRTASGLGGSNPAQPQVGSQGGQQAQFTYVPGQGLVPANK